MSLLGFKDQPFERPKLGICEDFSDLANAMILKAFLLQPISSPPKFIEISGNWRNG